MRRKTLYWVVALATLTLCAWALSALAAETAPPEKGEAAVTGEGKVYVPADTKVALLPFINAVGKDSEEHRKACQMATKQLANLFASHRFQVVDESAVAEALKKLEIDLSDSEDRSKENFQRVAEELGANLVVCGAMVNFKSSTESGFLASRKVGHARIELKVYDSQDKVYRVRVVQGGTSKGSFLFPEFVRGGGLREAALQDAIEKALKEFLKPYPAVKGKEKPSS
jgi:TolB-like protein